MNFYDYLTKTFGTNEPIFSSDIKFEQYSKPWIAKELAKLCETGQLIRFERGIYYIPINTPFGSSILNPRKVIERKYIVDNGKVNGFYSGFTALNMLGLSTQMPNTVEICTNNETSKLRNIKVGNQSVTLRRSRVEINNKNLNILRFLEIMNTVPTDFFDSDRKEIMVKWLAENNITRKLVSKYAPEFPDRAMRNLVESEVIYHVAQ